MQTNVTIGDLVFPSGEHYIVVKRISREIFLWFFEKKSTEYFLKDAATGELVEYSELELSQILRTAEILDPFEKLPGE